MNSVKRIYSLWVFLSLTFSMTGCLREQATPPEIPAEKKTSVTVYRTATVYATSTPVIIPVLANIQPMRYSLDIKGTEWLLNAAQEGVSFHVTGIYAINNKIAFLFGSFASRVGNVRSALFRTEDGGQHWLEVMVPITSGEANHVLFVQDGIGWASIALTPEGLAGTNYWRSSDYGKSWEKIPNVATGRENNVLGIRFFDSLHGQRIIFDGVGIPKTDGLVIQTTNDSGYTWAESLRIHTSGIQESQKIIAAYADSDGGRYGSHWGRCKWNISNGCQALGQDGSEWSVTYDESKEYYIVSIQTIDESELSSYKVPVNFIYEDGELRTP